MDICINTDCLDYTENRYSCCLLYDGYSILRDVCAVYIPKNKDSSLASDKQVGGSHYKQWKIQPFEFFQKNNVPFHKADIVKRILRYNLPTGKGKEDLEKIKHEIDLIMEWEEW